MPSQQWGGSGLLAGVGQVLQWASDQSAGGAQSGSALALGRGVLGLGEKRVPMQGGAGSGRAVLGDISDVHVTQLDPQLIILVQQCHLLTRLAQSCCLVPWGEGQRLSSGVS